MMNLRLSLFSTLALSTPISSAGQYLAFDAYGTPLEIGDNEEAYDQNQNHAGGVSPTISADHVSLRSVGNRWSAYALPSTQEIYPDSVLQFTFTLDEDTVSGFQSICLDADKELTGPNGQCFALTTTQGWIDNMINVAKRTDVGQTTHHSIPIGHFFTGPVNYLAFLQDSDGDLTAKGKGNSTISNLRLVQMDRNKLNVEIGGQAQQLENHQLSYTYKGGKQDTSDWLMAISEDGYGVQINGNQWKALPLNSPYNVTHYTILQLDVVVTEPGDFHAICLDSNLDLEDGGKPCVSFMTPRDNFFNMLTTEVVANQHKTLVVPYGVMMGLLEGDSKMANYIAFVQDNDVGDKRGGRTTFSNIRIYEENRMDVKIKVFEVNVTIPNYQESFTMASSSTYVQDSIDHVMSVSAGGESIAMYGNSFKRLKLNEPFEVTKDTMLKFKLDIPQEAELHVICLLKSNNARDGRDDCFAASGIDVTSSSDSYQKIDPLTRTGGSREYTIWIGSYFTGPVTHIGFAQDNDKAYTSTRTEGESSYSNIEIYNLPRLNIGLDDSSFDIVNNQIWYESTSQDNTPIRDHLAIVPDDGSSITVHGNIWRAWQLIPAMTAQELGDFVVSFDYVLQEAGEFHAICFEDNRELGDFDDPTDNEYDPKRCVMPNEFDKGSNKVFFYNYEPEVGETHRYVVNLGKLFDRFYEWKYLAIVSDNDVDKSVGDMTVSNIHITTSLTSCLKDTSYLFQVEDCTIDNFLAGVKTKMAHYSCPGDDPLLELMALFDATWETDVYREIEHICRASYEAHEYDFAKMISSETQVVKEFIDGGTVLNYERDSEGSSLAKDGAGIAMSEQFAESHLLKWPKHHALDHCDIGAAMCCWIDSRGDAELADNTDICYVNMKASKRTAHVADGYSIYGDSGEGAVNCHGFAWGTDGGSVAEALKGNALFKVGFVDNFYRGLKGNVEQVPGAPMCGCVDRMPVVTNAGCTKVADDTSVVDITYYPNVGAFNAKFTMGSITYDDCGDLNSYYKTLVGAESADSDYMDTRIVGDGGCHGAINSFLAGKGLVKSD